jgi:hypothetical protein
VEFARTVVALLLVVVAAGADAKPDSKWRIKCNGKSKVAGEVVLSIEPEGGKPVEVVIAIPEGTSENAAAVIVRDSLKVPLRDTHKVERDDWEDVLVKKRYKQPDFELILEDNTAEGLGIKVKEE